MPDAKILPDQVSAFTVDAMSGWFSDQGKIKSASELDFNRTLASYGLKQTDVTSLSNHVVAHVTKATGHNVKLPAKWARQYLDMTVGEYAVGATAKLVSALPGCPDDGRRTGGFLDSG